MRGPCFTLLAGAMCVIACSDSPADQTRPTTAAVATTPVPAAPTANQPKVPPSDPVAERGAPAPCLGGETCHSAAVAQERAQRLHEAAALYERACGMGSGRSCHRLGELYQDGKGVKPSDERARSLFEQGCRQGSTAACDALGH